MNQTAHQKLKELIDVYGADLDTWPEHIDASIRQRIQQDRSLQAHLSQTSELDDCLQSLLHRDRLEQTAMLSLAERIQANRPSTAAPAGRHWWSWFTAMPLKSAFAAALIATVIVTTMQVSPPQVQTDLVFAQWAWEEVLDETPDSQPGVLSDEFGFLITDS